MRLVIAEKPSVARDIAKVLGATTRGDNCLIGDKVRVTWCFGHLVELADADTYHARYKSWRLEDLPILPECFELASRPDALDQLERLSGWLTDGEHTEVINACDAGREGEYIFGLVYAWSASTLPVQRLWISSLTPDAIRQGFATLAPGSDYQSLLAAARARSQADWLVGINLTRLLTLLARKRAPGSKTPVTPVGRVQTPTLALIANRARAHDTFVPETFFTLEAEFSHQGSSYTGVLVNIETTQPERFMDPEKARYVRELIETCPSAVITRVDVKDSSTSPPLLFDLTSLQREANILWGWSAAKTLEVAQELYEVHKLLTYPRTDSRHISQDVADELDASIQALASHDELGEHASACVLPKTWTKRHVDPSKVSDHHAILPTSLDATHKTLGDDARQLYTLVSRRLLASLATPVLAQNTTVITRIGLEQDANDPDVARFLTRGRRILEHGWQLIEPPKSTKKDDALIPSWVTPDLDVSVEQARAKEGTTRAPALLTEASLLRAMETAGASLEDEEANIAAALHQVGGLGTPATRAGTIEGLMRRKLAMREGKSLRPTELGASLIHALAQDGQLTSAATTGKWEFALRKVEHGEYTEEHFLAHIRRFVQRQVSHYLAHPPALSLSAAPSLGACPRCGEQVLQNDDWVWCTRRSTTGEGGCDFIVNRKLNGASVPLDYIKMALASTPPRTPLIQGFRSRDGKSFSAQLELAWDADQKRWRWFHIFETAKAAGTCPVCSANVLHKGARAWCTKNCGWSIWTEVAKKKLSTAQVKQLLTNKSVGPIKGLTSKSGKKFEALLVLRAPNTNAKDPWKISFDFENTPKPKKRKSARRKSTRKGR